jgi:hypothetical protein
MDKENRLKLEHLKKLRSLNVDLTEYLISSIQKPEKIIQIINPKNDPEINNNKNSPNLHFHD